MSATVTKAFIISTWFAFYSVRARFASLSHQMTFITLIILWHSDEHFHPVTPSESSITETPVSAAIINWLNIQVEKGPAWNPALGTARILTTMECQEWCETETIGGDSTIANGNNRYHVTSWWEGSWEKHSDAQSNTNGYYKMCQWLQLYSVAMERIMKLQGQQLDLETFAESHLIWTNDPSSSLSTGYWNNHLRKETLILSPPSFDYLSPLLSLCVIHKTAQPREYRDAHFNY